MSRSVPQPVRRILASCALVAGLGAVVLLLAQCNMVGERLTGVDLAAKSRHSHCPQDCRREYHEAVKHERKRFHDAAEECRERAKPDRADCLEAAARHFEQRLHALEADLEDCLNSCHDQGSGSAG